VVPWSGRDRICHLIDAARHTLFVQNERFQNMVVIEHLIRAARRGVKVHLMARPPHTLKKVKLVEGVGGLRIMDDVGILSACRHHRAPTHTQLSRSNAVRPFFR
jgi:hypothetical protein